MRRSPKVRAHRDAVDIHRVYLQQISRFNPLGKEDEVALAQAIERGTVADARLFDAIDLAPIEADELLRVAHLGEDAYEALVRAHLRLVVSIAQPYQRLGSPLLDLIQDGNMGLLRAVERFDWRKNFRFSTYATWWIRQAVTRGISNTSRIIRVPVHTLERLAQIRGARTRLQIELERAPSVAEIAGDLAISEEKVLEAMRFEYQPQSLDQLGADDAGFGLSDLVEDVAAVSPVDAVIHAQIPIEVSDLLSALDDRERRVISLRFGLDCGEPRTLEEVRRDLDLSREGIRKIEARAIRKLRNREDQERFASLR